MKNLLVTIAICSSLAACASTPSDGARRSPIRDCPLGMVLICESNREQRPSSGGDEEIPQYDRCRCENVM